MNLLNGLKVINIGLRCFADDLQEQNVEVIHVDWSPPAAGDDDLIKLLQMINSEQDIDEGITPKSDE